MQKKSQQEVICNNCKYYELSENANQEMNYRCMHPHYKGLLWIDEDVEVNCDFYSEEVDRDICMT